MGHPDPEPRGGSSAPPPAVMAQPERPQDSWGTSAGALHVPVLPVLCLAAGASAGRSGDRWERWIFSCLCLPVIRDEGNTKLGGRAHLLEGRKALQRGPGCIDGLRPTG